MTSISARVFAAALLLALSLATAGEAAVKKRVKVTGEVIDSWCYLTEIMYPLGTAHHQCAVWCAAGGIPVGILGDDGETYIVLKMGKGGRNVADPAVLEIQTRKVTVDADLIERDGVKYLIVDRVVEDAGVVNQTHQEYGIQPFGD
jgi:hypothetical protein